MHKKFIFITNNPSIFQKYQNHDSIFVQYIAEYDFCDILRETQSFIEKGYHLMTHPLASNLKPKQCPYKSVLLSKDIAVFSAERDSEIIKVSIQTADKLSKGMKNPRWNEKCLKDFQIIDMSVVESALQSSLLRQWVM